MNTDSQTIATETPSEERSSQRISEGTSQRYPFSALERKWQQRWADGDIYHTTEDPTRPKSYILTMFPYPSGSGLHVGHCKNYVPGDVVARFRKMQGDNVLHPMGWDAFGQPAERAAIKDGVNPKKLIPLLAAEYRRQLSVLGISYDWNREINSTDPDYYKWNQWAFLLLYKKGLAYRSNAPVNWCVNEATVLANEEVVDGRCWRCEGPVIKKPLPQWFFKITAYGDKLLDGLERIAWPEGVKTQQRDWIGRSEGAEVTFLTPNTSPRSLAEVPALSGKREIRRATVAQYPITVFTTRPDTLWGATFLVLAPEHPLVEVITTEDRRDTVLAYRDAVQSLGEEARTAENREKTGVFTGAYAMNPVNNEAIPVWIADYVLMGYGTGAIMAVPAHDQRDFEFARKFDLPIVLVYASEDVTDAAQMTVALPTGGTFRPELNAPFTGEPNSKETVSKVIHWLEERGMGKGRVNFKLRDWLVSRQRYWGTPIPMIHCPSCGVVPVPESDLPVVLPDVESYQPGPDGRSPLSTIEEWVNVACPQCGGAATRETDTMAGSVDSSWYFLRYTSPHETNAPWSREAADYWMPVDLYLGGREHAVGHLLYCRFFQKVFFDAGLVSVDEPALALRNQGMLLGQTAVERYFDSQLGKDDFHPIKPEELPGFDLDSWVARFAKEGPFEAVRRIRPTGEPERLEPVKIEFQWMKMSKSQGNAVTPKEMTEKYGADALRLYVLFEAPYEDTIQWSEERMNGTFRFLARAFDTVSEIAIGFDLNFADRLPDAISSEEKALRRKTHQTIVRTQENIADLRFNTAVSGLMILADALRKFSAAHGTQSAAVQEGAFVFVKLLSPFAPHTADELYERLGYRDANGEPVSLWNESWPVADASVAAEEEITLVVQVNGKLRDRITLPADADAKTCEEAALASDRVRELTAGKTLKKIVVVPGKLVNIVL